MGASRSVVVCNHRYVVSCSMATTALGQAIELWP